MWENACRGDFTLITNALAREYMHSEVAAQCQGVDQSGDVIDEEDDDMDEEGGDENGEEQSEMNGTSNLPSFGTSSSSSMAVLPVITETEEERGGMMGAEEGGEVWEEVGTKKSTKVNRNNKGRR